MVQSPYCSHKMSFKFSFNTIDRARDNTNYEDVSSESASNHINNDVQQSQDSLACRVLRISTDVISHLLNSSSHTDISLPHNSSSNRLQSLRKINIEKNQSKNQNLVESLGDDGLYEKANQSNTDIIPGKNETMLG